jgi:hypothetical protein
MKTDDFAHLGASASNHVIPCFACPEEFARPVTPESNTCFRLDRASWLLQNSSTAADPARILGFAPGQGAHTGGWPSIGTKIGESPVSEGTTAHNGRSRPDRLLTADLAPLWLAISSTSSCFRSPLIVL